MVKDRSFIPREKWQCLVQTILSFLAPFSSYVQVRDHWLCLGSGIFAWESMSMFQALKDQNS